MKFTWNKGNLFTVVACYIFLVLYKIQWNEFLLYLAKRQKQNHFRKVC